MFIGGGGGQFMDTQSELNVSNYQGTDSFVPSLNDPCESEIGKSETFDLN